MNDDLVLDYPIFNDKVRVNKREVIKNIEKKTEEGKLELIKAALREKNFSFDDSINDYHEFVKYVDSELAGGELYLAKKVIDTINKEVDQMINELTNGSTTAFKDFINRIGKKVELVGNIATNSLAVNTIITLVPTAVGKAGIGIVLTGLSLYNLNKTDKYKQMTNLTYELNKILQELEITKDANGKLIDTRFNETIVNTIKEFLKNNSIVYEDTGYLSLRDTIYNLSNEQKEMLCNILNNQKGNTINVDERITPYREGLFKRIGDKYIKEMSIGAAGGATIATTINSINPGLLAGPANGTIVGTIVNSLTNNGIVKWVSGLLTGIAGVFGQYIPVIGGVLKTVLSVENLVALSVAGAGVGLLSALGKKIISIIKNRKNNFETQSNMKEIQELDLKLYGEKDLEEIRLITERLTKDKENREKFIINIVCQYMNELGIDYGRIPNSFKELQELVANLPKKEKKAVNKLVTSLDDYLHREPNGFKRVMKKVGEFLKKGITIGLAGMSLADIFTGGAFLKFIKEKLFGTTKVPSLISDFNDEKGIVAFEEMKEKIEMKPQPQPKPKATPRPPTTPKPSTIPTSPLPDNIKSVTDLVSKYGDLDHEKIIEQLSELSDEQLFKFFKDGHDPMYMQKGLSILDDETFLRFKKYLEISGEIDRSKPGYLMLRDAFNNSIEEKNIAIQAIIDEMARNAQFVKTTDTIAKTEAITAEVAEEVQKNKYLKKEYH